LLRAANDEFMHNCVNSKELINGLDPDEIRAQLADLDGQSRALRTLLRSALARRRREMKEVDNSEVDPRRGKGVTP
jgi:hypothetical protein